MRKARMRVAVVATLALGVLLQAGAFVQKARACEPMRRVEAERPDCCRLASQTRWTEEGGDCCIRLVVPEGDPTLRPDVTHEVGQAPAVPVAMGEVRLPAPAPAWSGAWDALERGPPLPVPTENIVLLN